MRWLPAELVLAVLVVSVSGQQAITCNETARDSSRLAIAGGSLTEIVYFLGAQERIVAVDTTSNYPPEARDFPSVGYVRNLSAEGLLSLNPDLILGEHDMGPPAVVAQVARTGVDMVRIPEAQTAQGILAKVRCVARILNLQSIAEQRIAARLDPLVASLAHLAANPVDTPPRVALLLGLRGGVPLAAGRNTGGDGLLKMAGAQNLFSAFEGWKPVSLEAMANANPDFIVITRRGMESAGGMHAIASHAAIRLTAAARNQRIIAMDGMALLGFGPRTLEAALELAVKLQDLPHNSSVAETSRVLAE